MPSQKIESFVVLNKPSHKHQGKKSISLFNPDGTTFAGGRILLQHSVYQHPSEWTYANLDHDSATGIISLAGYGPGQTTLIRDANTKSYFQADITPDSEEWYQGGYDWPVPSSGAVEIQLHAQLSWNSLPASDGPVTVQANLHGSAFDNPLNGQLDIKQTSGPSVVSSSIVMPFDLEYWDGDIISYHTYLQTTTGVTEEFAVRRLMYTVTFVPNTPVDDHPGAVWSFD